MGRSTLENWDEAQTTVTSMSSTPVANGLPTTRLSAASLARFVQASCSMNMASM